MSRIVMPKAQAEEFVEALEDWIRILILDAQYECGSKEIRDARNKVRDVFLVEDPE